MDHLSAYSEAGFTELPAIHNRTKVVTPYKEPTQQMHYHDQLDVDIVKGAKKQSVMTVNETPMQKTEPALNQDYSDNTSIAKLPPINQPPTKRAQDADQSDTNQPQDDAEDMRRFLS